MARTTRASNDTRRPPGAPPERRRSAASTTRQATTPRAREYVVVAGIALAARLAAIVALERVALWRTPSLDSLEYVELASRIQALVWPAYAPHAPGYPAFLAALFALHVPLFGVRIVQACLGAATCVLAARLAARTIDPRAFLPTGILLAVYGPLVVDDVAILAEGFFVFVLMAALNLAHDAAGRTRRWLVAGVAIGAATTIRPTALALVPAFATVLLWRSRPRAGAWRHVAGMLAGIVLVLTPLLWHGWREGNVVPAQGWGGMNFYIGNAPRGTGRASLRPGPGWDDLEGAAGRAGELTPQTADAYYVRRTLVEIWQSPAAYARLLGTKALWLMQADELRDSHSFYFFTSEVPPLGWLPAFGVLIALAGAGLVEAVRRSQVPALPAMYLVATAVSCLSLVVGSRYRLPMIPALAIFAGVAIVWIADAARERRVLLAACAAACVFFLLAHARVDASSHAFAEEWTLTGEGLERADDLAGAEQACRRALEIDPRSPLALDLLGWVQFRQGRIDLARGTLTQATAEGPGYSRAWYHLGEVERQAGDSARAIAAFERSFNITPARLEIVEALGQQLLAAHRYGDARPLLRRVASSDPENGTAHFGLALIALAEGRANDALQEATITTRLLPQYGRAWLLRARAAVAASRQDQAEEALSRALQAGSDPREVVAGRVKLLLMRGDRQSAEMLVASTAAGEPATAAIIWREVESW